MKCWVVFFLTELTEFTEHFGVELERRKKTSSPNPYPVGRGVESEVTPIELLISETKKPTSFL